MYQAGLLRLLTQSDYNTLNTKINNNYNTLNNNIVQLSQYKANIFTKTGRWTPPEKGKTYLFYTIPTCKFAIIYFYGILNATSNTQIKICCGKQSTNSSDSYDVITLQESDGSYSKCAYTFYYGAYNIFLSNLGGTEFFESKIGNQIFFYNTIHNDGTITTRIDGVYFT